MRPRSREGSSLLTTRRFGLSAGEWATTAVAAVVSTGGYLSGGSSYLARGVVADLLGFALLAGAGLAVHRRVRHEALICLVLIGAVLLLDPQWPLALPETAWWAMFFVGLTAYVSVRRRVCD